MASHSSKTRVREVYFYKTESGEYKIDLVNGRNTLVKEPLYYSNHTETMDFIETIQNNKNDKFEVSALGMKIYNKKPEERLLTVESENIFNAYIENLSELKENSEYSHKVASLLRSVADIVEPSNAETIMPEEPVAIEPLPPVTDLVPLSLIDYIQESLNSVVMMDDLTFWFQDQKFYICKDGYEKSVPETRIPKTSHNILGTLEYIDNLLGSNSERNLKMGENSIRFTFEGEVFKIVHIYTGDHNTLL